MRFTKMHGAGNDYVYVNCFDEPMPTDPAALAQCVSDRHFGIGGDGLILICPSTKADARMRMFNADGSEAEMCGNGVRCVAKYVYDHGICRNKTLHIETGRGVLAIELEVVGEKVRRARVDMGEPILEPARIPVLLPPPFQSASVVDYPVDSCVSLSGPGELQSHINQEDRHSCLSKTAGLTHKMTDRNVCPPDDAILLLSGPDAWKATCGWNPRMTCVSMGNPHVVFFCREVAVVPLESIGAFLERAPIFPQRINVHFVQIESPSEVIMRTWERGSGITLACGTGACATCVAGVLTGRTERRILAHLPGGDLNLEWAADNHVFLTGEAVEVFSGEM